MKYVGTPCAHCADGCKTTLNVRNNEILRGNNRDKTGINAEFLCIKGRYAGDFVRHPERLQTPLLRRANQLVEVTWDEALEFVARRLQDVLSLHGAQRIGFLGSNRTTNEENYLLQRLARGVLGTNNVDHHRTADFAALMAALGGDARRLAASGELSRAGAVLLVGNDPTHNHPLLAYNIRAAVRHWGARVYIINTRPIKLRRQARQFVSVPEGEEAAAVEALLGGGQGLDGPVLSQLAQLRSALGQEKDVIVVFGAELYGDAVRRLVEFGNSLPGNTRYIALADYANSRGAADMGLLPDRLPGYGSVLDPASRGRWEQLWKVSLPPAAGLDARRMLTGGQLRALYVVGSNPVKTFGLPPRREALGSLELLIVQELFLTETAQLADLVLPAASAYEKDGTFTNTCGEVQRLRRPLEPVGARSDFEIFRLLSYALKQPIPLRTPEAALEEIRQNVPGYQVSLGTLLTGQAALTAPADGRGRVETPAGLVFSSDDSLFTSGTLGRYSKTLNSVRERHLPRTEL
jgi:NADH-quinone oxidoreductase subunit G